MWSKQPRFNRQSDRPNKSLKPLRFCFLGHWLFENLSFLSFTTHKHRLVNIFIYLNAGQCGVLVGFDDQVIGLYINQSQNHVLPPSSFQYRQQIFFSCGKTWRYTENSLIKTVSCGIIHFTRSIQTYIYKLFRKTFNRLERFEVKQGEKPAIKIIQVV